MRKIKRHNFIRTNYTDLQDNQKITAVIYTLWNKHSGWCTEYSPVGSLVDSSTGFLTTNYTTCSIETIKNCLTEKVMSVSIVIDTFLDEHCLAHEKTGTYSLPVVKKNKANMITQLDTNISDIMTVSDMWRFCPKYMNEALRYNMLPETAKSHADLVFHTLEQAKSRLDIQHYSNSGIDAPDRVERIAS